MIAYKVVAVVFIVLLVAYFIEVFGLIRLLRASHRDTWEGIGSPDLFSPAGQSKFFSLVLGRNKAAFQALRGAIRKKCIRVRCYMAVGIASFLILAVMLLAMQPVQSG